MSKSIWQWKNIYHPNYYLIYLLLGDVFPKLDVHTQFRHNQGVSDYCIMVTVGFFMKLWCK